MSARSWNIVLSIILLSSVGLLAFSIFFYPFISAADNARLTAQLLNAQEDRIAPDTLKVLFEYHIPKKDFDSSNQLTIDAILKTSFGGNLRIGEHLVPNVENGKQQLEFLLGYRNEGGVKMPYQLQFSLYHMDSTGRILYIADTRFFTFDRRKPTNRQIEF